ncbi:MBL fold metallo-hydrolase [Pseudonocardia sp. TRM90224]|uniref:MBL fold metallo-hydrolase n=1 Tax=Pseudonocardia sp. TRM90224 TaxID=2812678 RepID=UPI001E3FC3A2|nr:MBL fold metallo-hydrolase [Pseudonocardia sp. TRM90224]
MTPVLRRVVVGVLDTNCWVLHADGDRRALVVDPGDDAPAIAAAVTDLDVVAIVLTHAHFDHVLAAPELAARWQVPVLAHPGDAPVWPDELDVVRRTGFWDAGTATDDLLATTPDRLLPPAGPLWDGRSTPVADGEVLEVGQLRVEVLHTPGHSPGGISLLVGEHVLTGDTLFPGGPGLTGTRLSDFPTIIRSVRRLFELPGGTRVHPGHGADTSIGTERPHLREWVVRGW